MMAVAQRRAPQTSVSALVHAARGGDGEAFVELYRRHVKTVHGVLLARLPRTELEDALQEVFMSALSKLDSLREPAAFSAWIASIARNLARDWHKRRREHSATPELIDAQRGPSRNLDDALGVLEAIQQLPEAYRELMVLRFVEGLSGPEIAAALDITPGSARVKLHRGLTMLRAQLRPTEVGDD